MKLSKGRQDLANKDKMTPAKLFSWWFPFLTYTAAKSLQSCPTLCDPIDGSPPGSAVPGILQAGTLEWVAMAFSNAWTWKVKVKSLSRVQLFATPWTVAHQTPLSMEFSRQEYWSFYFLLQGSSRPRNQTLISCVSCTAGGFFTTSNTWEALEETWALSLKTDLVGAP